MVGRLSQYHKLRATLSVPRYAPTLCVFLFFQISEYSALSLEIKLLNPKLTSRTTHYSPSTPTLK